MFLYFYSALGFALASVLSLGRLLTGRAINSCRSVNSMKLSAWRRNSSAIIGG